MQILYVLPVLVTFQLAEVEHKHVLINQNEKGRGVVLTSLVLEEWDVFWSTIGKVEIGGKKGRESEREGKEERRNKRRRGECVKGRGKEERDTIKWYDHISKHYCYYASMLTPKTIST